MCLLLTFLLVRSFINPYNQVKLCVKINLFYFLTSYIVMHIPYLPDFRENMSSIYFLLIRTIVKSLKQIIFLLIFFNFLTVAFLHFFSSRDYRSSHLKQFRYMLYSSDMDHRKRFSRDDSLTSLGQCT